MKIEEVVGTTLSNAEILSAVKLNSLLKLINVRDIDKDASDLIDDKLVKNSKIKKNKVLSLVPDIKPLKTSIKLEKEQHE